MRDSNSRQEFYSGTFSNLTFLRPLNVKFLNEQKRLSDNLNAKNRMIEEIPVLNKSLLDRDNSNNYDLLELNNVLNLTQEVIRFITEELKTQ